MRFPWILQRYILREMGKVFLLTAIAMTGVIGLGGGVLKVIKLGEMTPGQLAWLMALLLPVAAALTLPIAALFSASATYGRFSADNEFVACRSSGIDMRLLFLPTLALSLASATVTFLFISFLIPGMVRNLNEFVGTDVGAMIQQRLKRPKGITLGGRYRITADNAVMDPSDRNGVVLQRVSFVEVDDQEWVRFGSAHEISLRFDRLDDRLRVWGWMNGLSYYDRRDERFGDIARQDIPPNELPTLVPLEIKFLNLWQLLHFWRNPDDWREVRAETDRLRLALGRRALYEDLFTAWNDADGWVLDDGHVRLAIRSPSKPLRIPRDGGIELVSPTIEEVANGRSRTVRADRAVLELSRGDSLEESVIQIEAYGARVSAEGTSAGRAKLSLVPAAPPQALIDSVARLSTAELMNPAPDASDQDPLAKRRAQAAGVRGEVVRKIAATICERFAYSASVFVLVILGAALGVVFRGAQVVTAFGISFLPALLVIVLIVMGKQMAQNAPTHVGGLTVMWGGIVFIAALDVWFLTKVVRR